MEDYSLLEMEQIKDKKIILMIEDDEQFIKNNFLESSIELIPIRFSYDLSNFSNDYIDKTKNLFTYYYNEKDTYTNQLIKLKKHFIHYQRYPYIAYIPKEIIEQYPLLNKLLVELKIEIVDDKVKFLKKVKCNKKLILIDSDDTLRRTDGIITNNTKNAINKIKDLGNYIVICTSRPRYQILKIVNECNTTPIVISSNGSEIFDINENRIISSFAINKEECYKLIDYAYLHDVRLVLSIDNFDFVTKNVRNSNQVLLDRNNYYSMLEGKEVKQCMFIDDKVDEIYSLKEKIKTNNKIKIVDEININDSYEEKWFSISDIKASKGSALKILADYLDVPIINTIAIGNDYNDLSMFESASFSIAVENADDYIKNKVDYVTLSNNDDGVAVVLEKIAYNKMGENNEGVNCK